MALTPTLPDWSPQSPTWSSEERSLLPLEIAQCDDIPLSDFLQKSGNFPRAFPIDTPRCKSLKASVEEEILTRNINSTYPILHENVLHLYSQFILHKRRNGNTIEKSLYKDMDLLKFVDRLLTKRAVTFMGKRDLYVLSNGKKGSQNWESIGTTNEKPPLVLSVCLSYEEIKLSAFLSVSSYTYFVNIGDRKNFAVFKKERDEIEDEGIIIGIIGPRLVKEEMMEYQELVITKKQNVKEKGYGKDGPPTIQKLMAKFYDEECLEYDEVIHKKKHLPKTIQRYTDLKAGDIFDNFIYYKRLIFSMDTLFLEANQRALERNKTAYIHVVGIGLGVWKKSPLQNKLFMDSCGKRIQILGKNLSNVSDICFAYISHDRCLKFKNGELIPIEGHPLGGIKVHMFKREPHSRLTGNEFWNKKLGSSGDSAAASSTQISELHNPFINPKVCAANLKVVMAGKAIGLDEYVQSIKRGKKRHSED